jgi:hypothetical protein
MGSFQMFLFNVHIGQLWIVYPLLAIEGSAALRRRRRISSGGKMLLCLEMPRAPATGNGSCHARTPDVRWRLGDFASVP